MRRIALAPRDVRALTIAGGGIALMLLWMLVLAPYLHAVGEARERLQSSRDLLRRERHLLAEAEQYPRLWEMGAARLVQVAPRLFGGESDGAASAALAGYVQAVAKDHRVLIVQVETLPTAAAGAGVTSIPVRVRGESDLEGLLSFLNEIESGAKLVRVGQLQVDRAGVAGRQDIAGPEVLSFQFTATGITLREMGREDLPETAGREETP